MSNGAIIGIGVAVLVLLAVVLLAGAARRRDTGDATGALSRETRKRDKGAPVLSAETAKGAGKQVERTAALERRGSSTEVVKASDGPIVPWTPPDPELVGVTRRSFLNRGIIGLMSFGLTAFGLSLIGFLWPSSSGGFGSKLRIAKGDIDAGLTAGKGFFYVPEGKMWITNFPSAALEKARSIYSPAELPGMEGGYVFLFQKCPHLGCRVPQCDTSQWFECGCHGSQYNLVGEKKGGPAPRGMDRFAVEAAGDAFIVNTGQVIQGPPIGTNTTGQEAEGPHCVN